MLVLCKNYGIRKYSTQISESLRSPAVTERAAYEAVRVQLGVQETAEGGEDKNVEYLQGKLQTVSKAAPREWSCVLLPAML